MDIIECIYCNGRINVQGDNIARNINYYGQCPKCGAEVDMVPDDDRYWDMYIGSVLHDTASVISYWL